MPVWGRAVGCTGAACLPALGGAALMAGPEPAAAAPLVRWDWVILAPKKNQLKKCVKIVQKKVTRPMQMAHA